MHSTPLSLAMALLRSLYLFEILALQLVLLFSVLSAYVYEMPEARVITDVPKQRTLNDALQVRDVGRHVVRTKAPRFMMELYEEHLRNPATLQDNIVRSFAAQSNGAFHFFNLTSFGHREIITKAEFRWFRRAHAVLPGHHFYRVDLYEVLESKVKPWRGNLILSRLLSMYTEGWEVFNITQTVTKWILNSSTNNGILVVATLNSGHWLETYVQSARETSYEENDAYLVVYSNDGRRRSSGEGVSTSGQNTGLPFEFLEFKSSLQAVVRKRRSTHKRASENEQVVNCQRTPLYVDFVKLGWAGWVISPRGYNAYHCSGSCPFPLSGSLHPTNHAIVQSIVNTLKLSSKVGRPCCVPDNLQPISLLYFDDDENVVLKQYDDMVAGSCGCH
ncbi:bone morphogenetic protein 2-like isoform X2 [Hemibagrus wyckioides]|uniref:bone morphogenetic protein 2-like isoform X2 n=1 Tax=Hemibagrus wyckioides TaxID=337641 RepID=UPI00266BDE0F|nr:bone morphogenetic protein 2-like isoform X2 [Hemibagrus wyckioides]